MVEGDHVSAHAASRINHRSPLLQGVAVRLFHPLRHDRTLHCRIGDISPDVA